MKKLFTLLFALACFVGMKAYDAVYIVGDSSPAGWNIGESDLAKTTLTKVSDNVFEWTGVLTKTTGEGFKLITTKNWNPAMHPSTAGLVLNEVGSDVVALPYTGDPDTKWTISETAEYTLRVTFRDTDVLVELEKVGSIGSSVPQVDGIYQISSAEMCEAFAKDLNEGLIENNCKAVLTQDIDLSSISAWTAIGTDAKKFIGTFDGQGYRIKGMKLDSTKKEQGFFGVAGAGATIKNLIIDASCTIVSGGQQCFAAFVGCCNLNGTITFENCGNEAAVVGQAQNNAAFLGCNYGQTQLVFNNCYNTGKVSGGWENGAFSGWTGGGATFNNCYNIGEVTEGETWARGTKTINNCYQTIGSDNGVVKVTAEQIASGEICFKLNGDQNTIAWYQTIGTDAYPVPFTGHSQVYANGEMRCDGSSVEGGTLSYSNESTSVIPPHSYENGFCSVCGKYQENALTATDGWFEIAQPWQLRWMAVSVTEHNATYGTANIKLTADIDYTEYKSDLFGNSQATAFRGTFDGQEHTITIDVVNNGTSRTGLFAYINAATIRNLIVEGNATSAGNNCVGGLGGRSDGNGTLIENVIVKTNVSYTGSNGDATCGGFFANMESEATIKNCAFLGSIKTGTAEGNGGLVGWAGSGSNNKYINCFIAPAEYTKNGNSADFARNNPSLTNCRVYTSGDAKLASGEICYEINNGGDNWYQNIGSDDTPLPFSSHSKVYANTSYNCDGTAKGEIVYGNTNEEDRDEHVEDEGGFCTVCNAMLHYVEGYMTPAADGYYEISDNKQMRWFAAMIKDYRKANSITSNDDCNAPVNARLTSDIDFTGVKDYAPIGGLYGQGNTRYNGTFDGQFHKITNLTLSLDQDNVGIFGVIAEGAVIKNLTLDSSCAITGKGHVGMVGEIWRSHDGEVHLTNLGNEANITGSGNNVGGILGVNMINGSSYAKLYMSDCYSTGKIEGNNENGQLTGWGGDGAVVEKCYAIGETVNADGFGRFPDGCTITNCFSDKNLDWGPTQITDKMLSSGELAYKLGSAFSQLIGTDAHPVFGNAKVSYIGDAGWATMYDTTTGYTLNGDIKAYTAVLNGSWLSLTEVENVPAETPVVLKGTYYNKIAADLPAINVANDLEGTDAPTEADGTMYILSEVDGKVCFYLAEGTIPAGKAYYQNSAVVGVKAFFFSGDNTTGIGAIDAQSSTTNGQPIYNLAGQRIQKMQKGLNIVGGKKILF